MHPLTHIDIFKGLLRNCLMAISVPLKMSRECATPLELVHHHLLHATV